MKKTLFVSSLLLVAATSISAQAAPASDNWVGTWKLNKAKSHLSPASTQPQMLKFEATAAGIKLTSEATDAQGKSMQSEYTSKFDGKDVAWTGNPSADMACPKRIDDNNYENVWKKDGKATTTARAVVSNDNKTLTITETPTDPQGSAAPFVAVFDRQ